MKFRFYENESFPIHIIGKSCFPSWPSSMDRAWNSFSDAINHLQQDHPLTTHAFVLMSNHYHWLCTYDIDSDPQVFDWFHELVSFNFLHSGIYVDDLFKDSAQVYKVEHFKYYQTLYKYVYRNPVEAGLSTQAELYKFSTLPSVLGLAAPRFKCTDNMNLIVDPFRTLNWINGLSKENIWFLS